MVVIRPRGERVGKQRGRGECYLTEIYTECTFVNEIKRRLTKRKVGLWVNGLILLRPRFLYLYVHSQHH